MKRAIALLTAVLTCFSMHLSAASNTFLDYQNYNHGYCPDCNCYPCRCDGHHNPDQDDSCESCEPCNSCDDTCDPCNPCAPVCGATCGKRVSLCAIGIAIVAVAIAVGIIAASSNGSNSNS